MVEAAVEMDRILLSMVQKATGLAIPIPMVDQGIGVEHCPRPPVTRVAEKFVSELDDENTSKVRRNGTEISS